MVQEMMHRLLGRVVGLTQVSYSLHSEQIRAGGVGPRRRIFPHARLGWETGSTKMFVRPLDPFDPPGGSVPGSGSVWGWVKVQLGPNGGSKR